MMQLLTGNMWVHSEFFSLDILVSCLIDSYIATCSSDPLPIAMIELMATVIVSYRYS